MVGLYNRRERKLRQRLGNADNSFKLPRCIGSTLWRAISITGLPDSNWNRTSFVIIPFYLLHLFSQTHEMTAQHFLRVWWQSRCTFTLAAP
jgi:hypothetical protein